MRKYFVLLKKELTELITPQVVIPMIVMLIILNVVGKVASRERKNSEGGQKVAVMDLDDSAGSRAALATLSQKGFVLSQLDPSPAAQAVAAVEATKSPALIVIPKGFGEGLESSAPQRVEVYAFLRTLSLGASLRVLGISRVVGALNEAASARLLAARAKGTDAAFLRKPVSSRDFVVLNGRQAEVSIGPLIGFIQSQTALIPAVMLMVIVLAAQMVAISVVNEKENKTLETLLSLPVERNAIVLAKLSGAAIVAFLFAGVYLIGFHSYMNDMAGDLLQGGTDSRLLEALGQLGLTLDYSGYLLMFISLFFGILCALSIAMILGLLAEDVKGAQIATLPVVILVLIPYLLTMVMDIQSASPVVRSLVMAIPFSHPFLATTNIFMGRKLAVVWGILYQGAVFVFFVTLATKLFSSEAVFTLKLWRPRKSS